VAGGGAGGDAPDAQASALGLPYGQPQPPKRLAHHGIQRITVEFSEKSRELSIIELIASISRETRQTDDDLPIGGSIDQTGFHQKWHPGPRPTGKDVK
jgi:hypothetical protein